MAEENIPMLIKNYNNLMDGNSLDIPVTFHLTKENIHAVLEKSFESDKDVDQGPEFVLCALFTACKDDLSLSNEMALSATKCILLKSIANESQATSYSIYLKEFTTTYCDLIQIN
jgi:hypothetical protein